jgi:hypothetical protein
MRRYDIVTGILLILSTIDFTLAAPVLVQGNQARVDVVHVPKDLTTMLGKRLGEELEKLGEEYFTTSGKAVDSSGTLSSSSSASLGPGHGPTSPNQASLTANPPLMESPCSPSTSSMQGLSARGNSNGKSCLGLLGDALTHGGPHQMHGDGLIMYSLYRPFPMMEAPALQPKPVKGPSINPSADPNVDQGYSTNAEDPTPSSAAPRPARPKGSHGPSGYAPGPPPTELPTEPENEAVPRPPPSTDSEAQLEHQSMSAGSQPVDLEAAIYEAKGKAVKESRSIPGAASDVGNATQRDLQRIERSLDPEE